VKGFITGGNRGIGRAIAEAVAHRTTELTVLGRDEETLAGTRTALEALGCPVEVVTADQADLSTFRTALSEWASAKPGRDLDFVVLNAGTYTEGDLSTFDMDTFRRDLDINLNAHLVALQELLPCLRRGSRKRVFITGSTAAYEPYPLVPSYGVAKAALRALAANLRVELMKHRIGVSFVSPGGTLTDMWEGEDLPENRLLQPSDIGVLVDACLGLSEQAVVEQIVVVPMEGDIHE
jgi:NAD(P)-dependent dehydrogenase (short-subunit alcohol dehydrogenase family)